MKHHYRGDIQATVNPSTQFFSPTDTVVEVSMVTSLLRQENCLTFYYKHRYKVILNLYIEVGRICFKNLGSESTEPQPIHTKGNYQKNLSNTRSYKDVTALLKTGCVTRKHPPILLVCVFLNTLENANNLSNIQN